MKHCKDCYVTECDAVQETPDCVEDFDHRWTSEGCGGLSQNPGVWSLGGTSYGFTRRCVLCGVREHELHRGTQRNPGECDERRYEDGDIDPDEAAAERRRQRRNALARKRRKQKRFAASTERA